MEMRPGPLASSGNLLCPLSRTEILNMRLQMQINKLCYLFHGMAIGRNYETARVAGFVYFVWVGAGGG